MVQHTLFQIQMVDKTYNGKERDNCKEKKNNNI